MEIFGDGVLSVVMITSAPAAVSQAATAPTISVDAKAALAVDAKSGQILYANQADTVLPIASMTKMIGIYLVLDAIHSGKLQWDQQITPDPVAYKISQNHELSNVPLRSDGKYTVKELYEASLIYSANAAMMLLGDIVSGSQAKFVQKMQQQLQAWGIHDATIVNTTGLNNSALGTAIVPGTDKNAENMMSARSVAIVAQHLLTDYPQVLETTKITKKTFHAGTSDAIVMDNFNHMLPGLSAADATLPVDGLKTGTTDLAGENFTGTVAKEGRRIITVVMHANGEGGDNKRFVQTAKLMHYALDEFKPVTLATAGQPLSTAKSVTVKYGADDKVAIAPNRSLTAYVPKDAGNASVVYRYTATKKQLTAPETKGTKVGSVAVTVNGQPLQFLDQSQAAPLTLTTTKTVKKANFFVLIFRGIGEFFSNLF
nr:D-alanyl-D-alanine carboxypeptidase family protein [Lacticaseibacillus saniviri]